MARWWASHIRRCTDGGDKAHRTDTDLGAENVRSYPATARRPDPCV